MFNWKTEAPQVYNIYLSVLTDPNTPVGLTRQQLLDRAETIVDETPKLFFPYIKSKNRKTRKPDLNWASKNIEWSKAYRNDYKKRTIVDDLDYPFSLSDLDNPSLKILPESIARIIECMKDANALGIQFTRRLAKWVSRIDKAEPPLNNILSTTGVSLTYTIGRELVIDESGEEKMATKKRWVFGVLDVAVIYSRAERNHAMSNSAISFDSSTLDKIFLFEEPPEGSQMQLDYYFINPHLDKFFKFLAEKGTTQIDSRKYIKKFTEFPKYAHDQLKGIGSENKLFNVDFNMFINDDDLPTIFDRYISNPDIERWKIAKEDYALVKQGKMSSTEAIKRKGQRLNKT